MAEWSATKRVDGQTLLPESVALPYGRAAQLLEATHGNHRHERRAGHPGATFGLHECSEPCACEPVLMQREHTRTNPAANRTGEAAP